MKLQEFLEKHELTTTEFGDKIGIHRNTICNALNFTDIRLSTALAIEDATFGKVTCRDLAQKNSENLHKNKCDDYKSHTKKYRKRKVHAETSNI
jgi:hypothetical protein